MFSRAARPCSSVRMNSLNEPGTVLTLPSTPAGSSWASKSKSRLV